MKHGRETLWSSDINVKAGFYLNVVKKRDFSFSLKLETLTIKVYIAKSFGRVFAIF